jgi:hypothetical protein
MGITVNWRIVLDLVNKACQEYATLNLYGRVNMLYPIIHCDNLKRG